MLQELAMGLTRCCRRKYPGVTIDSAAYGGLILISQHGTTDDVNKRRADPIHVFPGAQLVQASGALAFDRTASDASDF
jgi:hypothetical protein